MTHTISSSTTSQLSDAAQELLHHACWYHALTLAERLASLRTLTENDPRTNAHHTQQALHKLEQWRKQKPFDSATYFADRLAMDTLTEDDLLVILGESIETVQERTQETPVWLQEIVQAFDTFHPSDTSYPHSLQETEHSNTISMAPFLLLRSVEPLVQSGLEKLKVSIARLTTTYTTLPFDPHTILFILLAQLPESLFAKIHRTLTLELNIARMEERLQGNTPEERFQDFVQKISQPDGMLPILQEYAPLARILVQTLENWMNSRLELVERLCADWHTLCQTFAPNTDPGILMKIDGGIGDLHKRGRSTIRLEFTSGFQLIYKPKSMAVDIHFQELLAWLNERGDHPAFRMVKSLDKGVYGWSEFVAAHGCHSTEEIARFYERQGAYLALLYVLEATDVHCENLIAAGEHPVLIDLEALFHPRVEGHTLTQSQKTLTGVMLYSVLRVGLLPQRLWGKNAAESVDLSGLGGQQGQILPQPVSRLTETGTDQMHIVRQQIELQAKHNRPTLAGNDVNVLDYSDRIIDGFTTMYRLLMKYREELLAGPLAQFAHDEIRLIVRPTQMYSQLLQESYHPYLLSDALDRDRFFDRLWIQVKQRPYLRRVIPAEQADLHGGDIPMFTTYPASRDIYTSYGERIPDFFDELSMESVKKILLRFDERDLARQLWFIQATLASLPIGNGHIAWKHVQLHPSQNRATSDRLIKAACAVGDRLCEQALQDEDGEANWIGLTCISDYVWDLLPAGMDLYNGAPGIVLFLAYLGAITGKEQYTAMARAALISVQKQADAFKGHLTALGAFDGWGSLIYLYTHLGTLWNEQELFQKAEEVVKLVPDLIEKDNALDMISGVAGCISCLAGLYEVTRLADVLPIAIQCGNHLAAHMLAPRKGNEQQAVTGPLTGFSHGTAGYALSLLRLAAISGEERFRQAASAAMEYERSTYSPEKENWPDLRDLKTPTSSTESSDNHDKTFMITWCHGAAGIGLARLASLQYLDDEAIREEIAISLKTTLTQGFNMNHSLCHGDLGNLDVLLTASQVMHEPQYREPVEHLTAMILDSIETHGWYTGVPLSVETPGLMTGIAGIGYELLRLAEPEKVPSVLTLAFPVERRS